MACGCRRGDWVEIHNVILQPEERSRDVPDDTKKVPLEAWIKGWALEDGEIGQEVEIRTPAGRRVKGTLTRVNPGYTHTFGPAIPELSNIGKKLRAMLREGK
ncbi:MAG: 2-amino-4-ketopentanoate thiolase [Candidatus Fermentithermobacillus carboniphilus]|uniref:2-amino-4-ketopentanoate thiolase n=1 Tax=Candidatus Fermentithermobacillus carboniphilus TaxID=3085328 RepID=A0AAT9L9F5_9FIRM|nr:MAG: 2-amino-4-ketopentanoate thiolase [Candidatus Fermentithermobacillus carboniphilus]